LIERLVRDARVLPALALCALVFGLAAHGNATLVQSGTYAAIYALPAIGLSLLLGNTNQISLGQAGFFGIGAYTVAYLTTRSNLPAGVGWPVAALLGIVLATLVGLVLGVIALRFRGHYLATATLAFGVIFYGIVHESRPLGAVSGITGVPFAQLGNFHIAGDAAYWFSWALVFIVAVLTANIVRARTGRAFEALRSDTLAAEGLGIPTRRYKILAFAYAGACAGLGGALFAPFLGLVVPDAVGVQLSIDLLLMVVLGGSGSVSGAIFGAALIGFLDVSGHQYQNVRQVAYGVLVVLVVALAPGGAFGLLGTLQRRRRAAPRPHIPAAVAPPAAPAVPPAASPLEVRGATQRFGGLVAVNDVSFTLAPGTLTALIGPNGAGKTTLFNAICGVNRLSSGTIRVDGMDVTGWPAHRIAAAGVGRTFQNTRLFGDMTVFENVMTGAFRTSRAPFAADLLALPAARRATRDAAERAQATLARLQLLPLAETPARVLAFGERRRVELARALVAEPSLVLVDEPAAGLVAAERELLHADLATLRAAGTTVLLIEHDMRLVMAVSERVMVLEFGRLIADGTPSEVQANPAVVAAYLGTAAR
jgi:branched-chain amino acid transport system permease protein